MCMCAYACACLRADDNREVDGAQREEAQREEHAARAVERAERRRRVGQLGEVLRVEDVDDGEGDARDLDHAWCRWWDAGGMQVGCGLDAV